MDKKELELFLNFRKPFLGNPKLIKAAGLQLSGGVSALVKEDDDLGTLIFNHTMTESGGGSIGGQSRLIAMTSDPEALAQSTDPRVQEIVQTAPIMATFAVPKDAALGTKCT